jgi:glycerophosphoryl diester phosphodiesterase
MLIQSHRGAGNLAPENTIESFELGWRIGCVPEADVRATKDGVPVAFHDNNFARLAPDAPARMRDLRVNDLTWKDIAGLDVGSYTGEQFRGQRIPRLDDILRAMAGRPERLLYMDVKDVNVQLLADIARGHRVTRQLILASTVYDHLLKWKFLVPDSMTLLWMGGAEARLRERMDEFRASSFEAITQLQIHVNVTDMAADDPFDPSSEFLREVGRELKSRGILFQSLPWGVAEVPVYHRLMDLGVESFATDEPEVTLEAARTKR